jgi:DNA polymerase (family 10)
VDILADGSLDFGEDVLAELDWVVASPHVSLKQETQKATDRILRAIDTKYVNLIGHPTGRIINQRNGLPLEISSIVERAAKANVGLEINAGWPRLDLRDTHAHAALAAGVTLSINTDAHSIEGLDGMHLGVAVARRAGATISDVLNTWKGEKLLDFIAAKR